MAPPFVVLYQKEIASHLRSKRLYILGGLIVAGAAFAVTLMWFAHSVFGDDFGVSALDLTSLYMAFPGLGGVALLQLLCLVITGDAISGEWHGRTLGLLLTKPVRRWEVVLSKLAASVTVACVFALALLVLVAVSLLVVGFPFGDSSGLREFGLDLLGLVVGVAAFCALGVFFSTMSRSTALNMLVAFGMWLVGFRLLGLVGGLIGLLAGGIDAAAAAFQWTAVLDPSTLMSAAIAGGDGAVGMMARLLQFDPALGFSIVLVALAAHFAVYFGLATLIVSRRDFD